MERQKIRNGRHYLYNDDEFVVLNVSFIKVNAISDFIIDCVIYKRVKDNAVFCKEIDDFITNFCPIELEVGDMVEAVSMDRPRGILVVESVDKANDVVKFQGRDILAKTNIHPISFLIQVDKPEQATDYFYVKPKFKNLIETDVIKIAIDKWKRILGDSEIPENVQMSIVEKIRKIQEIISQ